MGNSAGREKAGELGRGCLAGLTPGLRFWSFKRHWNHNGLEGRRQPDQTPWEGSCLQLYTELIRRGKSDRVACWEASPSSCERFDS